MNNLHLLYAMQEMIYYTLIAVLVIILPVLIVGLIFSVLQAATQINEMTLTFIPKLVVMFTIIFILSPWMMTKLTNLFHHYLENLPFYVR